MGTSSRHVLRTVFLLSFLVLGMGGVHRPVYAADLPAPPYLVSGTHHVLVGVVWDEAAIKKALPPGISPVKEMTGLINIYEVERGYGITPYKAVYFSVDVEGFDSPSGIKARWILQGAYGPNATAAAAMRKYFGLPVRAGTARIASTSDGMRAIGSAEARDVVSVEIKPSAKPCTPASFTLNYVSGLGVIEIPVSGDACEAHPLAVEVIAPGDDPFSEFRPVKLLWASEFKNGAFSISRPLTR